MPVRLALMLLTYLGQAAPAPACETGGGSTFCADGWISAPVSRDRRKDPDPEWTDTGAPASEGDVWVEGAMPVDVELPPEKEGL